jgi:hypothetical protein
MTRIVDSSVHIHTTTSLAPYPPPWFGEVVAILPVDPTSEREESAYLSGPLETQASFSRWIARSLVGSTVSPTSPGFF